MQIPEMLQLVFETLKLLNEDLEVYDIASLLKFLEEFG